MSGAERRRPPAIATGRGPDSRPRRPRRGHDDLGQFHARGAEELFDDRDVFGSRGEDRRSQRRDLAAIEARRVQDRDEPSGPGIPSARQRCTESGSGLMRRRLAAVGAPGDQTEARRGRGRRHSPRRRSGGPSPPARLVRPSGVLATAIEPVPAITPTPQPSGVPAATTRSPSLTMISRSAHFPASAHSPRSWLSSGRSKPASPRQATATVLDSSPASCERRGDRGLEGLPRGRGTDGLGVRGPGHASADHALLSARPGGRPSRSRRRRPRAREG